MTFQEFLATKRALAIVEHMDTLSEADARELFESLDDSTVELIEQLLSEEGEETEAERKTKDVVKKAIPSAYSTNRLENPFDMTLPISGDTVKFKHGIRKDLAARSADAVDKIAAGEGKRAARIKEMETLISNTTDPKQLKMLQDKLARMQASHEHLTRHAPKAIANQQRAATSTQAHLDRLSGKNN
jgi:hypothetical protein